MKPKKKMKMNYKIIGKYIKELKFEIPDPATFFSLEKDISNYKINIDIKSKQFKNKIIEVETTLFLNPTNSNLDKINTKIAYACVVQIDENVNDKKILEEIILIKVPGEIYTEIRSLFVSLFERSGFKKIQIEKNIDFRALYTKRTIQ